MAPAIPIRNIYYLLLYSWNRLPEGKLLDVAGDEDTDLADLFMRVLCSGTRHLIRRGLDRGYLPIEEDTACLRGRIDCSETAKRLLLTRGQARCILDELSYDVLHNQLLKSTLIRLSRVPSLDSELREQANCILRQFHQVNHAKLNRGAFRRLQLHRNNGFYRFLMRVCELVHQNLLPDERTGDYRFREFIRDERTMASVFEEFVFNFFRLEQSRFQVSSDVLSWDATSEEDHDLSFLPSMRTDITLRSADQTIVIDTKYYKETLQRHFSKASIHSGHLYQICTYLKSLQMNGGPDSFAAGILLYPVVSQRLDLRYRIHGHPVRVCTLDLAQEWQCIRNDLLGLIDAT